MYPYFDLNSLLLYTVIGILGAYCIRLGINNRNDVSFPWQTGYVGFILTYVLLAGLRLVTPNGIGGKDTYGYEIEFLDSLLSTSRFDEQDVLFGFYNKAIRSITDNVIIYRFICYFIITYAYIYFINAFCIKKDFLYTFHSIDDSLFKKFQHYEKQSCYCRYINRIGNAEKKENIMEHCINVRISLYP